MDPIVELDTKEAVDSGLTFDPTFDVVLVTGSTGMLGGYLAEAFCELNRLGISRAKVVLASRSMTPYLNALADHYGDVVQLVAIDSIHERISKSIRPLVIHAASPASPEEFSESAKGLLETNILLTLTIAEALAQTQGHLAFLSSGEIYGPTPDLPARETSMSGFDHLGTRGAYPESKRAGELIAKTFSERADFGATAWRIYHTFGPGIDVAQTRIFSTVVDSIIKGINIRLRTDGSAMRSFLYSSDLFFAIALRASQTDFQALNVAGDAELSIREFAMFADQLSGGLCKVELSRQESKPKGATVESPILRGSADTSKLKSLGWTPRVTIDQALVRTVESTKWRSSRFGGDS